MRTDAPEGSVVVRVSGSDVVDDERAADRPGGHAGSTSPPSRRSTDLQVWSVPNASILRQRPGRYYWQAYVSGEGGRTEPIGPVRQLTVTLPAADRGRGSLYPKFGKKGSAQLPRLDREPAVIGVQDALQDAREDHGHALGPEGGRD